ncbi:MAG TPA: hypothetical protein VHM90_07625 [Phycisphaerae bacterium]|nr:hypothetical protein [Phycisphaerae bacterium]
MSKSISCPKCKRVYAVKPEFAGKKAKCKCGEKIVFPAADAPAAPSELDLLSEAPVKAKAPPKSKSGFEPLETAADPYDVVETAPRKPPRPAAADGAACSNCGAPLAPGAVLCTACGFNQKTGAKIKTQVMGGAPGVLPYKSQPARGGGYSPPSEYRTKAGRILISLAVLVYIGSTCLGVGTVLIFAMANSAEIANKLPAGVAAFAGIALLLATLFSLAVGTTYLMCGLSIRKGGGLVPVIIALILGGLHELLAVLSLGFEALAMVNGGGNFIGFGIQLLFVVGVGQLIFYLIQILREPRN